MKGEKLWLMQVVEEQFINLMQVVVIQQLHLEVARLHKIINKQARQGQEWLCLFLCTCQSVILN